MKSVDYIPTVESKFFLWEKIFMAGASVSYKVWGISEGKWSELTDRQAYYHSKYAVAESPSTRTSAAVLAKNIARKGYVKALRQVIKGYITYNLNITDGERKLLGLPVHKTTRTPSPLAKYAPHIITRILNPRKLSFYFSATETSRSKPAGQHGIELISVIAITVTSMKELVNSDFATHTPLKITFKEEDRGKKLWYSAAWENTRGEKGPWTEIQSVIIP
ncbi:MAG: hypothetical protein LBJ17_09255 [Dysgonamonadaceae bacterium]|jgi:hypothetical protein|nr:hypothetical protein [Dysgonamonadaceae bacterium]